MEWAFFSFEKQLKYVLLCWWHFVMVSQRNLLCCTVTDMFVMEDAVETQLPLFPSTVMQPYDILSMLAVEDERLLVENKMSA